MRSPALLVVPVALLAVACGSSNSPSTTSAPPATATTQSARPHLSAQISTRKLAGFGVVLVNGSGRTLYVFTPEKGGKVKCTGSCASLWPPMTTPTGGTPGVVRAAALVKRSLISHVTSPSGESIATYAGWPLHTYAQDTVAGSTKGQGVGGQWYMLSTSGKPITRMASSSSSSSSGSGGY